MIRTVTTLFWREVESLFFAPLAYIVLTIFLALNGATFVNALEVTGGVVSDTLALYFASVFWICLAFVPALVTMRSIAEERRTGQLEVTLTAPVRDGELVVAKFLGALFFQLFLWAPTLLYVVVIKNYGVLPDPGQLITSYVGILCVTALLTAVGLFFSAVTTNQIVAAVASITANLALLIGPQMIQTHQYTALRGIIRPLSISDHFAESFSLGVLDTSELAFYAAGTAGLLVVATRLLETRRWR